MNKLTIVYHSPCNDGFCAAWVAWNWLKKSLPEPMRIQFIKANYGETNGFEKLVKGIEKGIHNELWILDFSYSVEEMRTLGKLYNKVMIIDHHEKSVVELEDVDLGSNVEKVLNVNSSGALLTWYRLYGSSYVDWRVLYVNDRDLWLNKLEHTEAINTYFKELEPTFEAWDKVNKLDAILYGNLLLKFYNKLIDDHLKFVTKKVLVTNSRKYTVAVVTCTVKQIVSELGNKMCENSDIDFAIVEGHTHCSLRTTKNDVNVNMIAQNYDGGGHPKAAGCTKKILDFAKNL